jgi:hypothetical protein
LRRGDIDNGVERLTSGSDYTAETLFELTECSVSGLRVAIERSVPDARSALRGLDVPAVIEGTVGHPGSMKDLVGTYYVALHLISRRFVDVLIAAQATGWYVTPVSVRDGKYDLSLLVITGRAGSVVRASPDSKIAGSAFGSYLSGADWDGTDFMVPDNEERILVAPRLVAVLSNARLSNVCLEPAGLEQLPT